MSKLFVITGPSGVGKTYLADILLATRKYESAKVITTRKPRQSEQAIDRTFVDMKAFETMLSKGQFVVHGTFHDNNYGYTNEALTTDEKSKIVNAWPALMPQFLSLPDVITVTLTIDPAERTLLYRRMAERGDSLVSIEQRKRIIEKDIQDIEKFRKQLEAHGRIFMIKSDSTIHDEVVPWIQSQSH